jgi:hypothetical protein
METTRTLTIYFDQKFYVNNTIIKNFNEWYRFNVSFSHLCQSERSLEVDILKVIGIIKDRVSGFMVIPVALYNGKTVIAQSFRAKSLNDISDVISTINGNFFCMVSILLPTKIIPNMLFV